MAKYRAWVAKIVVMEEFHTEAESRAWAMVARDNYKKANPNEEVYFDLDDCGVVSELCDSCESNEKEFPEGKYCASCKDDFKESDND